MSAELADQAGVDAMVHDLDDSELLDRGPDGVQHPGRRASPRAVSRSTTGIWYVMFLSGSHGAGSRGSAPNTGIWLQTSCGCRRAQARRRSVRPGRARAAVWSTPVIRMILVSAPEGLTNSSRAARPLGVAGDPDQGAEAARIAEGHPAEVRTDRPVLAVDDIADVTDHPVHRGQIQLAPHGDHGITVRGNLTAQLDRGVLAGIVAAVGLTAASSRLVSARP